MSKSRETHRQTPKTWWIDCNLLQNHISSRLVSSRLVSFRLVLFRLVLPPATIDHRSSTIDHRPSIIHHRSSTNKLFQQKILTSCNATKLSWMRGLKPYTHVQPSNQNGGGSNPIHSVPVQPSNAHHKSSHLSDCPRLYKQSNTQASNSQKASII
jgi:hypothetical protein